VTDCLAILALVVGLAWITSGIHFVARHHAVFRGSVALEGRVEIARRRIAELWTRAGVAYEKIDEERPALEVRWGKAVIETRVRQTESKRDAFESRVAEISNFSGARRAFNLYEVEAFFEEVKRLEEDLPDWTVAILNAIASARSGERGTPENKGKGEA